MLLLFLEGVEQKFEFHLLQQRAFIFVVNLKEIFVLELIFCRQNQIHYRIHDFLVKAKAELVDKEGHCFCHHHHYHHHHSHHRQYYFCY